MAASQRALWRAALAARRAGDAPLLCRTVEEMRCLRAAFDDAASASSPSCSRARVGFVPTMGSLHAGHLDLVDRARADGGRARAADFVVASVFVNPTQFAPHEDLARYPRSLARDVELLGARGCDAVFAPAASAMYPPSPAFAPHRTFVTPSEADAATPEGAARPGFFRGVATVVCKLLNIVQPTHAVFGQKDGMQCLVVRQMMRDLNLDGWCRIDVAPTTREADGLAMSSRNAYLSADERAAAPAIFRALSAARDRFRASPEGRALVDRAAKELGRRRWPASDYSDSALSDADAAVAVAAQQAAMFAGRGPMAPTAAPEVEPALQLVDQHVREVLLREGGGHLGAPQYLAFSDALTGRALSRAAESRARGGAVMMSVAVPVGSLRLLDNVLLVGEPDDLGANPDGDPDV